MSIFLRVDHVQLLQISFTYYLIIDKVLLFK